MTAKFLAILILALFILSTIFYRLYNILLNTQSVLDYDIIIVGSGLAGLSAAYEVNRISNGQTKILLVEKETKFGGNSQKASSGINILNTPVQAKQGVKDSYNYFYQDTIKSGKGRSNPKLVSTLIKDSSKVYDYLTANGIDLSKLGILGGHSKARTHAPNSGSVGDVITKTLVKIIQTHQNTTILNNTTVIDLIYSKYYNLVKGVVIKNNEDGIIKSLTCKSVILTTGGFAHDFIETEGEQSLIKEFAPTLMNYPTTNGPQAKGLGVKMARKIGAQLIDMKEIQVHPTGFVDPSDRFARNKFLAAEIIRGIGAILVNQDGVRYCNELGTRDYVTNQILKNCKKVPNDKGIDQYESFLILNEEGASAYPNIQFYISKGFFKKYDNFEAFANERGVNKNNLKQTIETYKKNINGTKDEFGKDLFPVLFDFNGPVYVSVITPSLHYTMGGIQINEDGEVIDKNHENIKGLFAAGEVTGGVHGANRLGGNSLCECAVYGFRAARKAVSYFNQTGFYKHDF